MRNIPMPRTADDAPMSIAPSELLAALSHPAAYPFAVDAVEVHQTHISMVFLAGDYAYKVKEPVQLGFLDFSTLERRKHFCEEEVRLNRRLAPQVYLGVVPVTRQDGGLRLAGVGPVVEWAVQMRRLPRQATLESRLADDGAAPLPWDALAQKLARTRGRDQPLELSRPGVTSDREVVAQSAKVRDREFAVDHLHFHQFR